MRKYRIIKKYPFYRVKIKGWFFWCYAKYCYKGGVNPLFAPVKFASKKQAIEWCRNDASGDGKYEFDIIMRFNLNES